MTWMNTPTPTANWMPPRKTGATWMRVLIDWICVEPMPGAFDWGYVDHWINGALEAAASTCLG